MARARTFFYVTASARADMPRYSSQRLCSASIVEIARLLAGFRTGDMVLPDGQRMTSACTGIYPQYTPVDDTYLLSSPSVATWALWLQRASMWPLTLLPKVRLCLLVEKVAGGIARVLPRPCLALRSALMRVWDVHVRLA